MAELRRKAASAPFAHLSCPASCMEDDIYSSSAYQTTAYLRIASISIAVYDLLETAPSTWRYAQEQWNTHRITISFVLFLLIQFTSILALTLSNFGFFFSAFTERACAHFYIVPSILKVVQSTVSQAILGLRAFNLSRRSRPVGWTLLGILLAVTALQWFTTLHQRTPVVDVNFVCCLGVFQIQYFGAWTYYVIAITYDLTTTTISMIFLFKYKTMATSNSVFSKVAKMMLYDGIGYFSALTAVNILNLIIYRASQDLQTSAASLGYTVTWIMSKRLIIHLHEVTVERRNEDIDAPTFSQSLTEPPSVPSQVIPQQPKASSVSLDLTILEFEEDALDTGTDWPDDIGVEIRVEKVVQVQRRPRALYELEDHSRWDVNSRH
ncbi:hypothetical protein BT96DRAFT_981760 [Gymnopus androsaceus JB14]|uniref:Uncharacterized protein n=1 Tax=Gymnopus androsaceus JB14 TaxID=1447944 RepID=A0A6A4GLF0_9AGAR|nr:hypothetical protein BT96DRAFT_981760 [Gymnopus androsaceus JB14]